MRKTLIAILMLLSCQTFSQVQEFILDNGLKVLVKEDHRAPIAVSMLWYRVGSSDEPGGKTGVSHAIEHMMFKGSTQFPPGIFSQMIAAIGGQENAFTNYDYTAYFEKTDASRLETSFKLEADRMNHLLLDGKEFAKEIQVIQEERRLRTDNNPQALTFERFLAAAHLAAPYHHPVIGWMSDLKQMNIEDVKQWYQDYYAPNNATLVVVGDVDAQKVRALAEHYFGIIPRRDITPKKFQQEPSVYGKKEVIVHASAKIPFIMLGYTVPSVATAKNAWEPYALEIMTVLLDGGDGSRFAKNIIRKKHVASSIDTYYNLYSRYQTQFIIYGAPSQNHGVQEVQQAALDELSTLKTTLLSESELNRVKHQIVAQKVFEKDSIFSQAMELGLLETVGIGWQKSNAYIKAIEAVTPEQIQQTAQRYFFENNMTVAELRPTR